MYIHLTKYELFETAVSVWIKRNFDGIDIAVVQRYYIEFSNIIELWLQYASLAGM